MQIKDFPNITSISDDDLILVQTASDNAYKNIKASDLQSYFGSGNGGNGGNGGSSSDYASLVANLAPQFFWDFNDTSGNIIADSSGNNNLGVISGTINYQQPGLRADETGNYSFGFIGSGLVYSDGILAGTDLFTEEIIFKTTDGNCSITSMSNAQTGTGSNFDREIQLSSGIPHFSFYSGATVTGTHDVADGNTHIITIVSGSTQLTMYLDGNLEAQVNQGGFQNYNAYLRVGYGVYGGWYTGLVDSVVFAIAVDPIENVVARHKVVLGL